MENLPDGLLHIVQICTASTSENRTYQRNVIPFFFFSVSSRRITQRARERVVRRTLYASNGRSRLSLVLDMCEVFRVTSEHGWIRERTKRLIERSSVACCIVGRIPVRMSVFQQRAGRLIVKNQKQIFGRTNGIRWTKGKRKHERKRERERKRIERINAVDKARVLSPLGCYRGLLGTRSHPSE